MVQQKSGTKRRTTGARHVQPAVTVERAVIGTLVSREAKAVTPLMSKVYLALLVVPPKYWDRRGVLHFTGEPHRGGWRTAWQQLLEVTGVASLTASKALQWLHKEQIIGYHAGRNGAFVLASVWLYQLCFLADYRTGKPLAYIKDHLDCARWRIPSG